jgi:hypothetical protein
VVVLAIAVQVAPPFVVYSHLIIEPICPLREIVPLFDPLHAFVVRAAERLPPPATGDAVTLIDAEFAEEHTPF